MSIVTAAEQPVAARLMRRAASFAVAVPVLIAGLAVPAAASASARPAGAYQQFCSENSDLCTVTVRVWNAYYQRNFIYACMLDDVANRCPSGAVIIGGPYHT